MLGSISEIIDNQAFVKLAIDINSQSNLINLHVIFEDGTKKIVGEIVNVSQTQLTVNIVGEIKNEKFFPGFSSKPSFKSKVRIIALNELELILGKQTPSVGQTFFGFSNIYQNYRINININDFFSNHFAILGNSGSGKSCTVASIIQKLFTSTPTAPIKSNIFIFDAFGEYTNAFSTLKNKNPNLSYKTYTTNTTFADSDIVKIPTWLLDVDDLALLLDVTTPNQLPILEKTLKLVPVLTGEESEVIKYKNDIIARAIEDILLSGANSTKIRDQVIAILTKFNTSQLNLESEIVQPGYVRTLKQCLFIDKTGKFQEIELVTEFIRSFIHKEFDQEEKKDSKTCFYNLADLEETLEFALISEGILKSEKVYDSANVLSVRLHSLVNSNNRKYFEYPKFVDRNTYVADLLTDRLTGNKCQIVNFNINYVDDRLAKVITKILSKMLFSLAVENENRGSIPFHILIEEAHRYVQKDKDVEILGYNIFERITKEGRKYGIFLGLITQRPSELSDTTISQCSNFVILRTIHPKDLDYIKNMVPNISSEVVQQLKSLQPGNCIAFGTAFKVPISMHVEFPNPAPNSNNVDLATIWYR
ncbi:MAG: ATP-binding protein [bacterium]|nr:ATP-binding protein [bacterium]